MNIAGKLAPLGAVLSLTAVPAAALAATAAPAGAAARPPAVSVRVEGLTRTLLPARQVRLHSGWIIRDGAKRGQCAADSAAGALDLATHHRWSGSFDAQYSDFLVTSILGVKYSVKAKDYWAFFAGHVMASSGVCATTPHAGESFLFAAVPLSDYGDYELALSAHGPARAGRALTVKVVYYDAAGRPRPLAGAKVSGRGIATATTNRRGLARITPTRAGTLVLSATHADQRIKGHPYGYIRAATVRLAVTG